jgi:DNA-binding NarL/FixJ family response regulator
MDPRDIDNPIALIVNSHHAVRRAVCDRIRSSFANFRLREAASIQDALCILEIEHIDIVLLDGEASGIDAVRGTRAILERAPKASVVLMSAMTEPACHSAARRAGAMAFVSKRALGTELMNVLETIARPRGPESLRDD